MLGRVLWLTLSLSTVITKVVLRETIVFYTCTEVSHNDHLAVFGILLWHRSVLCDLCRRIDKIDGILLFKGVFPIIVQHGRSCACYTLFSSWKSIYDQKKSRYDQTGRGLIDE